MSASASGAASEADPLELESVLAYEWKALRPLLESQPDAAAVVGPDRPPTVVPARTETFRALNFHPPADWKVVAFGQNPYPRPASAGGIAFLDEAVTSWAQKGLSPSLRNMLKNILVSEGKLATDARIADLRACLPELNLLPPRQWFTHTIVHGVCWLNTSLTFDAAAGTSHDAFWRPIISAIVSTILTAKQDRFNAALREGNAESPGNIGVVFVLWGARAQKRLKPLINSLAAPLSIPVRFVEAHVPSVETFHNVASFAAINDALAELGTEPIDWLPTATDRLVFRIPSISDSERSLPSRLRSDIKLGSDVSFVQQASSRDGDGGGDDDDGDGDTVLIDEHATLPLPTPPQASSASHAPPGPSSPPAPAAPTSGFLASLDKLKFNKSPAKRERRIGRSSPPAEPPAKRRVVPTDKPASPLSLIALETDPTHLVLGKPLGSGGFVKTLHEGGGESKDAFLAEVSLLLKVRHEHIVRILAVCTKGPRPCMVLELLPRNLSAVVREAAASPAGFLPLPRALVLLRDVADALRFLHSRTPPVLHRDLKPANVLVTESFRAKVCDFGISREKMATCAPGTMSKGIGTPVYMAPEMLESKPYSTKLDVYAFAMVMYNVLTCKPPFAGMGHDGGNLDPVQAIVKVITFNARPRCDAELFPPHLPPGVLTSMCRAWDRDPDARPDFDELVPLFDEWVVASAAASV
ncbi:TKL protein kinase [Thecamonas trahens ATCC 50062]|uniref:TKL protein kinase n=1 Tax=Thecamonas trahens ATCC 50062 TaxID=461836 RepID=A0A0L0DB22_THETB|nr:TKL protein kinase [Thecamonas trahens ATCC 50062]KNC49549.1 TKL protein kinase [Thecamonas trahens ATCC 50062]|eukprot:XP_013757660.1 TKL protein kinase [Thecamonas trahens ATCC 50062]